MSEKITIVHECGACKGTGLYRGMGEHGGACVICYKCNGTGCVNYAYTPFTGRKPKEGCNRVYKDGYGYCITDVNITNKAGRYMPFGEAGVTYQEWLDGKEPEHIKWLACPMMADQYECQKIGFKKEHCEATLGTIIPECALQPQKEKCWERFDQMKQQAKGRK